MKVKNRSDMTKSKLYRILIVDDVPDNVEVLGEALSEIYDVQFATSGEEALDLLKTGLPDLILLDVMMPSMNGFQFFGKLREIEAANKIPVIFVTAFHDAENETCALEAGAVDFIHKPINPLVVLARVKTHLMLRQREIELQEFKQALEHKVDERSQQVQLLNAALEERASQAEAANRTKALFLGNMSHELRTPMSAIIGFSEILKQKASDPEEVKKLSQIIRAAKHLSSTINDILDFTQIQSGQIKQQTTDFNLTDLIQRVVEANEEQAISKKLVYTSTIDPTIPNNLYGDPIKLEQILINLISNAIKFTRQGSITLQANLVSIVDEHVNLRFDVQDTGIGIDPSQLEHIFAPFEQADNGLSREYGGIGLGLSINRKLIEMMGGKMSVETEVSKGSRFRVDLKFKWCKKASKAPSDLTPLQMFQPIQSTCRILLVDDDYFNHSIFGMLLEDAGLAFDIANDGAEAVIKATNNAYDLILMDIQMPIMNGLEATLAIRKLPEKQQIPIVALSANTFDEDRERCFDVGMNAFIAKPILPQTFYTEIARWVLNPYASS